MKRVAIVGGGLTGLAAAYYLGKAQPDWLIDVYEASHRWGGKIQTKRVDGFVVEMGPDSYLARKTHMTQLVEDLGLGGDLVANATGQAYVYDKGQIYPIPGGAIMGIPTEFIPFAKSPLISWSGKIRAGLDFFKAPCHLDESGDISIGHFFLYHLGQEMMDKLIEPLLSGIYGGDVYKISLMATFPHFLQVEQKYGNMVKGMMNAAKAHKKAGVDKSMRGGDTHKGLFRQLQGGLYSLIEAIVEQMPPNISLHLGCPVRTIEKRGAMYRLALGERQEALVDRVIITTPPASYKQWFGQDAGFSPITHMEQTSCAIAIMAFDKASFDANLLGSGLLVTRKTHTPVTACTNLSQKWPQTTPDDKVVLRVFLGKPGDRTVQESSDDQLAGIAVKEIHTLLGFTAQPQWVEINRLIDCMPQYYVGHKARITEVASYVKSHYPGLHLIGTPFDGIGIPDGVRQAMELVESLSADR